MSRHLVLALLKVLPQAHKPGEGAFRMIVAATAILLLHFAWTPAPDADTTLPRPATVAVHSDGTGPELKTAARTSATSADGSAEPALEATSDSPVPRNSEALSTIRISSVESSKSEKVILPDAIPSRRKWMALSLIQHSAAAFDAYSTRQAVSNGASEEDPFMRPFAKSPAIYGAIQAGPLILDFAARKMQRSPNTLLRRTWWLPQSAGTAMFLFSGTHNLQLASRR